MRAINRTRRFCFRPEPLAAGEISPGPPFPRKNSQRLRPPLRAARAAALRLRLAPEQRRDVRLRVAGERVEHGGELRDRVVAAQGERADDARERLARPQALLRRLSRAVRSPVSASADFGASVLTLPCGRLGRPAVVRRPPGQPQTAVLPNSPHAKSSSRSARLDPTARRTEWRDGSRCVERRPESLRVFSRERRTWRDLASSQWFRAEAEAARSIDGAHGLPRAPAKKSSKRAAGAATRTRVAAPRGIQLVVGICLLPTCRLWYTTRLFN